MTYKLSIDVIHSTFRLSLNSDFKFNLFCVAMDLKIKKGYCIFSFKKSEFFCPAILSTYLAILTFIFLSCNYIFFYPIVQASFYTILLLAVNNCLI